MNTGLLLIGIIVILLGIGAMIYEETQTTSELWGLTSKTTTSNPYQEYSFPLIIGGVVLVVVGAFVGRGSE